MGSESIGKPSPMMIVPIENIQYHKWLRDDIVKVKLERGMKGAYAWELTAEGIDDAKTRERLREMDAKLREEYIPVITVTDPRD